MPEQRQGGGVLRRRAELQHECLDVVDVGGGVERAGVESGEGARLARGNRALECQGAEDDGGVLEFHVGLWQLQCGQLVRRGSCNWWRQLMRLCMAVIVAWTTLWAVGRRLGGGWQLGSS